MAEADVAAHPTDGVVRSAHEHFVERDECLAALACVCEAAERDHGAPASPVPGSPPASPTAVAAETVRQEELQADRVIALLEKYQEQSHLLDKHLELLVTRIMDAVKSVIRLRETDREAERQAAQDHQAASFPFQVYCNPGLQLVFKVLYTLCKVRGYKAVVKQLPHQVADLEPCLHLLQCQDAADYTTWETRYSLLLWMSMLVLIPFDLDTVDSSLAANATADNHSAGSLVQTTVELCKAYLADAGLCRQGAAICIARLLTRPDMESAHLESFLFWAAQTLEDVNTRRETNESLPTDVFLITGVFQALTEIFKHGHREKLLAHIPAIFSRVIAVTNREGQSSLERKLTMKLVQRTGLNFLPPRVVSWRYQRGKRSLLQNMARAGGAVEDAPDSSAPAHGPAAEPEEDEVDVPEEVEDVIEKLLCGLRDRDTIVRWSAAKGIGRITGRLPLELADDVVAFVLDLFDASEGDSAWHGGCLAIAELARRGLLLPDRLTKVVPFVVQALVYDVRRGHNSVGANVRDAACYVCWAFARAYEPAVMAPHVAQLCPQMLVTALFDREVNCRRAASAAFQENVGRQGHENFPHGIEILTAADYFTLGVRTNAFLKISDFVAQFEMYRKPLIDHLVERKLAHWDLALRTLAAEALHVLCARDPQYMATKILPELLPKTLSPDMLVRHGATLATAEIVTALAKVPFQLDKASLADVRNTVMRIEKARLYRGRGGEWMRVAACKLIKSMALAGHPLTFRAQKRLLESIEESMKHPKDEVKEAAVDALGALSHEYFGLNADLEDGADAPLADAALGKYDATAPTSADFDQLSQPALPQAMRPARAEVSALLVDATCDKLDPPDPNPAVRRGCALALGVLPARVLGATPAILSRVVSTLIKTARGTDEDEELRDAETRRNAVVSLAKLVETVGISTTRQVEIVRTVALSHSQVAAIFDALFFACNDHETDNRGDVGSWVRAVAIQSLAKIVAAIRRFPATLLAAEATGGAEEIHTRSFGPARILRRFAGGQVAWIRAESDAPGLVRKIVLEAERLDSPATEDEERKADDVIPGGAARAEAFVPGANERAVKSVKTQQPFEGIGQHVETCAGTFLPDNVSAKVVNAVLKQLCEKIGVLREGAGNVLVELLSEADSKDYGIPFTVPHLSALRTIFLNDEPKDRNWKVEAYTFPRVAQTMLFPEYIEAALEGLSTSVGDLTESVSKNASDAVLQWCKEHKAASAFGALDMVASTLLKLFESNTKCDRVVTPVLKTLDLLMEAQVLTYQRSPRTAWLLKTHDLIKSEIKGSANVHKLVACGKVLFHLASFPPPTRPIALGSILILLGHKYPVVRMSCAKSFNMWALAMDGTAVCGDPAETVPPPAPSAQDDDGDFLDFMRQQVRAHEQELAARPDAARLPMAPGFDPDNAFDDAQDVIAEAAWDKISTKAAREQRDRLYVLLRIKKPAAKKLDPAAEERRREELAQRVATAEDDSYATLVHSAEMGYK